MNKVLCCIVIIVLFATCIQPAWAKDCQCNFMTAYVPGYSFDITFETNFGVLREGFFQLSGGTIIAHCVCIEGHEESDCSELWEQGTGPEIDYVNDSLMCTWMNPSVGVWSCENTGCYDE